MKASHARPRTILTTSGATNLVLIGDIEFAVSRTMGIPIRHIRGRKKEARIAMARQTAMYLAYELMNDSYPAIGRMMNRDHSTIIHGHAAIEKRMKEDAGFRRLVHRISRVVTDESEGELALELAWERRINYSAEA